MHRRGKPGKPTRMTRPREHTVAVLSVLAAAAATVAILIGSLALERRRFLELASRAKGRPGSPVDRYTESAI